MLSVDMPRHHRDFLARTKKNHLKVFKGYTVTKSAGDFLRKGDISSRPHDIMKIKNLNLLKNSKN